MDRARHLRNYNLHSWVGIALGFFVFIVAFTGSLALFEEEISAWEDPARRLTLSETRPDIDPAIHAFADTMRAQGEITQFLVIFPKPHSPYYSARIAVASEDGGDAVIDWQRWSAETAEVLPERGDGLSVWLLDIHRHLMWPDALGGRTIGRALVGMIGVILMLAILTGVIAHTKIFEELFSLRYWRSVRLKWQDTHKVAGLWGLPFYAMMATTGAFLGIIVLLSPIIAVLAFKGDTNALVEAVVGTPVEPTGVEARMISMDEIETLQHPESGETPYRLVIQNWQDETAVYDVFYTADTELALYDTLTISGVTGAPAVSTVRASATSPANRVTNAMTPLHYATYGGMILKFVYLLLGLSLAIITAMGNMMWIERRLHGNEGQKSEAFYRRLSRLTVGVTTGLPLASLSIFYLDKLYFGAETGRLAATGWTYFGILAAVILIALIRRNDYRTVRDMLALLGIGLMGLPILNSIATSDLFWQAIFQDGRSVSASVDIAALLIGSIVLSISRYLPSDRPVRKRSAAPSSDATTDKIGLAAPAE